ncbi:MAG: hypothetical protein ABSD48_18620 [Armatimonadota bacterium]|jgi:hypothetical protein
MRGRAILVVCLLVFFSCALGWAAQLPGKIPSGPTAVTQKDVNE